MSLAEALSVVIGLAREHDDALSPEEQAAIATVSDWTSQTFAVRKARLMAEIDILNLVAKVLRREHQYAMRSIENVTRHIAKGLQPAEAQAFINLCGLGENQNDSGS